MPIKHNQEALSSPFLRLMRPPIRWALPPTKNGHTTLFPYSFPLNTKKPHTFPTLWTTYSQKEPIMLGNKGSHLNHHDRVRDHSIIIWADNTCWDIFQWPFNGVQNFHCSWNACKKNPNPNICEQHVVPSHLFPSTNCGGHTDWVPSQ